MNNIDTDRINDRASYIINACIGITSKIRDELSYEEIQASVFKDIKYIDIKKDSCKKVVSIINRMYPELYKITRTKTIWLFIRSIMYLFRNLEKV